ncbi:hypothetical protein CK203_095128 [Vitis vinifera]|uniref:EGF-like domain-containing protein n=1 Tax=Vitis vinifera TaxID=29760 RepID=A0A438DRK0_VITVI|nr:hypothetical protein CK203_095128 [Vitis vinifera]
MASTNLMASMALLLLLLPLSAMGDDWSPALSPFLDNLCDEVECGKGTCKASLEYKFNFICECDSGWKRTRGDNEDGLKYLPCVIPNCTLDYSCMTAPSPAPAVPHNESAFDPCYWMYCGEGKCTRSSAYGYKCECNSGYQNLLNISVYPCYSECALGSDCEKLGIKVSNSTSSSNSGDGSGGGSFLPGKAHWMALVLISMGLLLWK